MRMRATVVGPKTLLCFAKSIEKISSRCIMRMTPSKIHFALRDVGDGVQVWSTIPIQNVFDDYFIESNYINEIWLDVDIAFLCKAFKSMTQGSKAQMKLARDSDFEILSICVFSEKKDGTCIQVHQAVPVTPLKRAQILDLREPKLPQQEVYIVLPNLVSLKAVIDRIKTLTQIATISINTSGCMQITAETATVTLTTTFTNLQNAKLQHDQLEQSNEFKMVQFDVRDFLKFLQCIHSDPHHVICGLKCNFSLVFHVYISEYSQEQELRYYIPAKSI